MNISLRMLVSLLSAVCPLRRCTVCCAFAPHPAAELGRDTPANQPVCLMKSLLQEQARSGGQGRADAVHLCQPAVQYTELT